MISAGLDTSERPLVLVWEVTQACDLACDHCRADAQPQRHPDELTTAEGRQLLEDASRFGDNQLVVLSGGDPLARDDLVELVEYGTDLGLNVTLTPSGTSSLSERRIQELSDAGLRRMAISIDGGSAEMHDDFRGEAGSFEDTVSAARQARESGVPVQVNTTVCADTVGELPAIRDVVADLDAVLWSVFFLVPVGRGTTLEPVTPAHSEEIMKWLCGVQKSAAFPIKTTEAPHFRRVAAQRERNDSESQSESPATRSTGRRLGITAGDGFAFVSHVGEIYPSGFLPKSAGNVRSEDIIDVYRNADLFESLRDPDALNGKCGSCPFRSLCGGSRSRAYATTGNPLASDPLCPYIPEEYDGPLPERTLTA